MPTKEQLENRVRELEEENDRLQDQLDSTSLRHPKRKVKTRSVRVNRLDKTNSRCVLGNLK